MKSLVQWGATLGLLGSTLWGSLLGVSLPAWALEEQEIAEKLQAVPVFVLFEEGVPYVYPVTVPQGENAQDTVPVSWVFMHPAEAEAFVGMLANQDPDIVERIDVAVLSMADVYLFEPDNNSLPEDFEFAFVANQMQSDAAISLLEAQGAQLEFERFPGVPLFIGTAGPDLGYLTIEEDGQQQIPIFFSRAELEEYLEILKTEEPDLAETVGIEVESLQRLIGLMETMDDPVIEELKFIPAPETLEFLRNLPAEQ